MIKKYNLKKYNTGNLIHGMSQTSFYKCWKDLKKRCNNPNVAEFKNYGGRGIIYDPKWEQFINFYNDMYFKFIYAKRKYRKQKISIERENVNGNYEFNNCIFIPLKEQYNNLTNQSVFKAISPDGTVYFSNNQNGFARQHGLIQAGISHCINKRVIQHKGWKFYKENN